jgi:hypothetical protein
MRHSFGLKLQHVARGAGTLIGVLRCGVSVSLLFAIVTRPINREALSSPKEKGTGVTLRSPVPRKFSCRQTTK